MPLPSSLKLLKIVNLLFLHNNKQVFWNNKRWWTHLLIFSCLSISDRGSLFSWVNCYILCPSYYSFPIIIKIIFRRGRRFWIQLDAVLEQVSAEKSEQTCLLLLMSLHSVSSQWKAQQNTKAYLTKWEPWKCSSKGLLCSQLIKKKKKRQNKTKKSFTQTLFKSVIILSKAILRTCCSIAVYWIGRFHATLLKTTDI